MQCSGMLVDVMQCVQPCIMLYFFGSQVSKKPAGHGDNVLKRPAAAASQNVKQRPAAAMDPPAQASDTRDRGKQRYFMMNQDLFPEQVQKAFKEAD